jgi:hypothetical protein
MAPDRSRGVIAVQIFSSFGAGRADPPRLAGTSVLFKLPQASSNRNAGAAAPLDKATMKGWLGFPSVQVALAVAVFVAFASWAGPFATVLASPLLAVVVARPVLALLANVRHDMRARTWLPVHGHHFAFKGITIHVLEDETHCRWVSLADARKVVGMTASDSVLALTYPGRCARMGQGARLYLRDDALVEHLDKENNPAALRFRTWVDRDIAFPGRRIRRGLGITPEPPDQDDRVPKPSPTP